MSARIFGLRGAAWAFPPNTLLAFEAALAEGADGLACDVDVTADGHPVVCEDRLLRALAVGVRHVRDAQYDDLRKLDVGATLSPEHRGARVPALDEVLSSFAAHAPLILVLPALHAAGPTGVARVLDAILPLLAERLRRQPAEIGVLSDHPAALEEVRRSAPALRRILRVRERGKVGGTPQVALSGIDGLCLAVRGPDGSTRTIDPSLELFGIDCDTPTAARRAASGEYGTLLSERPGWLIGRLREAAGDARASNPPT